AKQWAVEPDTCEVRDGRAIHAASKRQFTYAELAANETAAKSFEENIPSDIAITPVKEWKVLGTGLSRPNGRDIVTGAHKYPSDIARPGMLYGKILRPPAYGAKLTDIDLAPAKAMKDVIVIRDEQFVGLAAPTALMAEQV